VVNLVDKGLTELMVRVMCGMFIIGFITLGVFLAAIVCLQ